MTPEPGDQLIFTSGDGERSGIFLGTARPDGGLRYLVHWIAGDYDALIKPGPAVRLVRSQAVPDAG